MPDPMAALARQGHQPDLSGEKATRAKPFARPERTPEADARNRARRHSDQRLGECWTVATRARKAARKADDEQRADYWRVFLVALAEEAATRRVPDRRNEWSDELLAARGAVREGRAPLAVG